MEESAKLAEIFNMNAQKKFQANRGYFGVLTQASQIFYSSRYLGGKS